MIPKCFQIHAADNVATLLDYADVGEVLVVNSAIGLPLFALNVIAIGHKIALTHVATGEPIIKFGVVIGRATRSIARGEWVHLHNCASNFDDRSAALDLHTGAANDTKYE